MDWRGWGRGDHLDGGAVGWCQSRTDRQPIRVSNNAQSWRGCYGHQNRMTENEMILPSFPPSCFFQPLCPIPAISLAARATSQEGDAPAPPSPRGHARRNKWGSRPQQLPSLSRRRAQRCRRGPRRLPALLALPMWQPHDPTLRQAPEARRCPALAVQWNRAAPGATVPPAGWPRCCGAAGGPPAGPAARILTSCSSAYFWIQQWRGGSHPREFFMGRRGSIAQGTTSWLAGYQCSVRSTSQLLREGNPQDDRE